MEPKKSEHLMDRTVAEQDVLIYYWYNQFEEQITSKVDEDFDVDYIFIDKDVIAENLDRISEFSMNNLLCLATSFDSEVKARATEEIVKKLEAGEHLFSGENIQPSSFGPMKDLWDSMYGTLGDGIMGGVVASIEERLTTFEKEDPEAFKVVNSFGKYAAIDNFFYCYDTGIITPEKLDFINEIFSKNPNLDKTINFGIFADNILDMGNDFIERLAKYPNMSNNFIRLSRTNPQLFEMVKDNFKGLEETKTVQEAREIEFKTLRYVTRKAFSIGEDVDFEALQNCAMRMQGNPYIELDYCDGYEQKYQELCDQAYENNKGRDYRKREVLCDKCFGMSEKDVQEFYTTYIKNIEQLGEQSPELQEYIANITRFMYAKTEEELDELYASIKAVTPLQRVSFEYNLREQYTQTIADSVQGTHNVIESSQDVEYIEFEGKTLEKIKIGDTFNLLVHSTDSGFREEKEVKDRDFLKAWDHLKNPSAHLVSSCFINQDFMGHVPVGGNGVLAVFADVGTEDLSLMGPTDIDSHILNYNYVSGSSMYMTADNLPYNSRKVYNEVPVERQRPTYFLVFDDTPEDILQNTYKAASDFGAKILFADKREIAKNQLDKLDELSEQFRETGDLTILQTLISTYETNVAGWLLNRDPSRPDDSLTQGINNERFREDFEARETAIYSLVVDYVKGVYGKDGYEEKLQQMSDIMQGEIDKYQLTDLEKTPISKVKMKFKASSIKEKLDVLLQGKGERTTEAPVTAQIIDLTELVGSAVMCGEGLGMSNLVAVTRLKEQYRDKEVQEYGA